MSDAYVGEIRMFAGTYAPQHWSFCSGTLMGISDNTALFSLIGAQYGGDGRVSFSLPDMRGRVPIHRGQGNALPNYVIGQKGGKEKVVLTSSQMPAHSHKVKASQNLANSINPSGNVPAKVTYTFYSDKVADESDPLEMMAQGMVSKTGNNNAHSNIMPYQTLSFIICLTGIYPSRS